MRKDQEFLKNTKYTVHDDYRLLKINKYAIEGEKRNRTLTRREKEKKVNDKTINCKIPSKVEWTVATGK